MVATTCTNCTTAHCIMHGTYLSTPTKAGAISKGAPHAFPAAAISSNHLHQPHHSPLRRVQCLLTPTKAGAISKGAPHAFPAAAISKGGHAFTSSTIPKGGHGTTFGYRGRGTRRPTHKVQPPGNPSYHRFVCQAHARTQAS